MLQACNTGHDGSLSTVHANSPGRRARPPRDARALLRCPRLPLPAIRHQLVAAIDAIVQVRRGRDGRRAIVAVAELGRGRGARTRPLLTRVDGRLVACAAPRTRRRAGPRSISSGSGRRARPDRRRRSASRRRRRVRARGRARYAVADRLRPDRSHARRRVPAWLAPRVERALDAAAIDVPVDAALSTWLWSAAVAAVVGFGVRRSADRARASRSRSRSALPVVVVGAARAPRRARSRSRCPRRSSASRRSCGRAAPSPPPSARSRPATARSRPTWRGSTRGCASARRSSDALARVVAGTRRRRGRRVGGCARALCVSVGGRSADALDGLATSLRDRLAVAAEARALSSQARMSAVVVGGAPLAYIAWSALVDPHALHVLTGTLFGRVCLLLGLGLEALGGVVDARDRAQREPRRDRAARGRLGRCGRRSRSSRSAAGSRPREHVRTCSCRARSGPRDGLAPRSCGRVVGSGRARFRPSAASGGCCAHRAARGAHRRHDDEMARQVAVAVDLVGVGVAAGHTPYLAVAARRALVAAARRARARRGRARVRDRVSRSTTRCASSAGATPAARGLADDVAHERAPRLAGRARARPPRVRAARRPSAPGRGPGPDGARPALLPPRGLRPARLRAAHGGSGDRRRDHPLTGPPSPQPFRTRPRASSTWRSFVLQLLSNALYSLVAPLGSFRGGPEHCRIRARDDRRGRHRGPRPHVGEAHEPHRRPVRHRRARPAASLMPIPITGGRNARHARVPAPDSQTPHSERGQATVELALVLPLVFALLVLVFQVALVARDEILVVHAARDAAREASVTRDPGRIAAAAARNLPGATVRVVRRGRSASRSRSTITYVSRTEPAVDRRVVARRHVARRLGHAGRRPVSAGRRATGCGRETSASSSPRSSSSRCCSCGAVARLGGAVVEKSRASNAADAAALAAAGALALGRSAVRACAVARATAIDNGARLLTCRGGAGDRRGDRRARRTPQAQRRAPRSIARSRRPASTRS